MYNLLLQLLFQSTVYNRKQEFREHRRHVKDQHTFTFGRVPVEWRLVRLQHTVVDCIRKFGNCNYVCSITITRVHVEWLRVKGEKKSSSHAHLCQPTSLGSFGSSSNGPSRAVIAVAVLWKYFFRKLSLERFIVWFVGQYMAFNQRYFLADCDYLTCHVCHTKN